MKNRPSHWSILGLSFLSLLLSHLPFCEAAGPSPSGIVLPTIAEVIEEPQKAVVYIVTRDAEGRDVGSGSGFIIDPSGKIVTNYHVIEKASFASALLSDNRILSVTGVLGIDPERDIAILKMDGRGLPAVKLGNSDEIRVGDRVIAIGSPGGLGQFNTVTDGLVSGIRRYAGHQHIQFSAPISPGSSGGALLNLKGEAVGMTTLHFRPPMQNINFAVPINYVQQVKSFLKELSLKSVTEAMTEVNRRKAETHYKRGEELQQSGQYDEAIEQFERAITLSPDLIGAHYSLGLLYQVHSKQLVEAAAQFGEVIRLDPQHSGAHSSLGTIYYKRGLLDLALRQFSEALNLNARDVIAYLGRAKIYAERKQHNEAIEAAKFALTINPSSLAYQILGEIYLNEGRFQQAADAYSQAISLSPTQPLLYFWRALALGAAVNSATNPKEFQSRITQALEAWQKYLITSKVAPEDRAYEIAMSAIQRLRELQAAGTGAELSFPSQKSVYVSKQYGFSISRPSNDWIIRDGGDPQRFTLLDNPNALVEIGNGQRFGFITVNVGAAPASLEGGRELVLEVFQRPPFHGFEKESEQALLVNGITALEVIFTVEFKGVPLKYLWLGLKTQTYFYRIMGVAPVNVFHLNLEDFRKAVRTFRLNESG